MPDLGQETLQERDNRIRRHLAQVEAGKGKLNGRISEKGELHRVLCFSWHSSAFQTSMCNLQPSDRTSGYGLNYRAKG